MMQLMMAWVLVACSAPQSQLHHDLADHEVPYEFSETLSKQIKAAGKTVELYSYPGDDHNLANSFGIAMQRSIQFFDKVVKNLQSPLSSALLP
jgi:dipeptidyl aminopeptidase/acylaminoacyl peptidase